MREQMKRMVAAVSAVCVIVAGLTMAGCGGGGGGAVSSQVVSGVAAVGATLSGQVKLKDSSSSPQEKMAVIGNDGTFAIDVTGMNAPFVLRAEGSAGGSTYRLHSFADGPGTANINPLTDVLVANAAGVDDPAKVYDTPDTATMQRIRTDLPEVTAEFMTKLARLLQKFNATAIDPLRGHYVADHSGLDGLFDHVTISISNGILTIKNAETGVVIFTGSIRDLKSGHMTDRDDDLPTSAGIPVAPSGVTATGGTGTVTVSWNAVAGAASYNVYWSTAPGVTKTGGTKIGGASSPYTHSGLTGGTSYYYIVTAVGPAGESAPSAEVTATTAAPPAPGPAVPAAPSGVQAAGGTNQVTVSWSAVSGASSYNLYWSTTTGVTPSTGTKLAGATSPAVHSGLAAGTTYFYVVTAVNSAGESQPSVQVAAKTVTPAPAPSAPAAPTGVAAAGGANQVTVSWSAVTGATSYNVYWSTSTGVTKASGTRIAGATSPYVHTSLAAGTTYYYVVTAVNAAGESAASSQATAATNAPPPAVPAAPTGVTATGGANQVSVSWSPVTGATSYNLYWSTTAGVTKASGTKITGASSPYGHTGLAASTAYYYVVTAVSGSGEGAASAQVTATTSAPAPPPAPACGSCHAIPPATGQHDFHVGTLSFSCAICHGTGYSSTTVNSATHMNGVKDLVSTVGWNAGTCSNSCHGSRTW